MKTIRVVILASGLGLLVCGCAAAPPGQVDSETVDSVDVGRQPGELVPYGVATPADAGSRLKQYGFAVLDFRAIKDEYGRISVVGEITNTGSAARGVELQATLRDADRRVIAVGHFCPASYKNILPGEKWPFTYSFGWRPEAIEAELRITGAFRTMDVLGISAAMQ